MDLTGIDYCVDELLNSSAKIYRLEDASGHHRQYVANLIWNDGSLELPDREYIQHIDDLVCLQGETEDSWIHRFVSKFLNFFGSAGRVRLLCPHVVDILLTTDFLEYLPHKATGTKTT